MNLKLLPNFFCKCSNNNRAKGEYTQKAKKNGKVKSNGHKKQNIEEKKCRKHENVKYQQEQLLS